MSEADAVAVSLDDLPRSPGAGTGRSLAWWGMMGLIVSEAALFAYLLVSYFYFQALVPEWPPGEMPELALTVPNTVVLLVSSLTMHWAERARARERTGRLRMALGLTFLLGSVFLAVQGWEYTRLGFGPASDAYGSIFFTITGFHGTHVLMGLVMLAFVQVWQWTGRLRGGRGEAILHNTGLYWHFVDLVWVVVFASLYLSPRVL